MTTTSTPAGHPSAPASDPTPARSETGRTRAGLISLIAGAVSLALARTLTNNGGSPAERLEQLHGHDAQVTASALLAVIGFTALIPGFLVVASQVRRRGSLLATNGSALVIVGSVGFAVLASVDASTLAASRVGSPRAMEAFLHQLDVSPIILAITPFALIGYFIGPFLITLAARRAGFAPRWLPWGVLISLIIQPVGLGLGGPAIAHLLDSACQLVLVVMTVVLARVTLAEHARLDWTAPGAGG